MVQFGEGRRHRPLPPGMPPSPPPPDRRPENCRSMRKKVHGEEVERVTRIEALKNMRHS